MPTSYTFSSLIKACASLSALGFGEAVHCHIWRNGFDSHVFVQTALIDFYSNFAKLVDQEGCLMKCLTEMFMHGLR